MKKVKGKILLISIFALSALTISGCNADKVEEQPDTAGVLVGVSKVVASTFYNTREYIAAVTPKESTDIIPHVSGIVQEILVDEGDSVKAGDVICKIDSDNVANSQESLATSTKTAAQSYSTLLDNMTVKAPVSGYVRSVDINAGEAIGPTTQVGYISDVTEMTISIPFLDADVDSSWIGASAELTLPETGESITGDVTKISGAPQYSSNNILVNYVEITVSNPGALSAGRSASATVKGILCSDTGVFEEKSGAMVTGSLSGYVNQILVKEGDYVTAGDGILTVTSPDLKSQVVSLKGNLDDLEAQARILEDSLDDYSVTTPVDGIITEQNLTVDTAVGTTSPVAVVESLNLLTLEFDVTKKIREGLKVGDSCDVSYQDKKTTAKIFEISDTADENTGLFSVKASIEGKEGDFLSGTTATVTVSISDGDDSLVIPFDAINFSGDNSFVYIDDGGVAARRDIVISDFNEVSAVVESGLDLGDEVISTWSSQLGDGTAVETEITDGAN